MANLYVWNGAVGTATGADWANAKTTLTAAFVTEVAGDTIFVAHDHAESTAGSVTLASGGTSALPTKIICVNRAGSVPPVSADRRATATVTTTGAGNISFTGVAHYDGVIFNCGSGVNAANINMQTTTSSYSRFDNCSLRLLATAAANKINSNAGGSVAELNNTTVSFGHSSHSIGVISVLKWRNTPSAVLGSIPATLFTMGTSGGEVECIGVDLSAIGAGSYIFDILTTSVAIKHRLIDCKLNAAVSISNSALPMSPGGSEIDVIRSGATGVNYTVHRRRISGLLTEETVIVRTGGATG